MTKPQIMVDIHPGQHVLESLRILGAHPFTLLGIAAFEAIPAAASNVMTATWTVAILFQIPFIVTQQLVTAALVYAAASFTDATTISAVDVLAAYRIALGKLRPLMELLIREVGAAFLLAITVVGFPLAIRLFVRWTFAIYAVMLNDLNAKGAISFSCELITGHWWQIAGLLLATSAPGFIVGALGLVMTNSLLVSALIGTVASLVAGPLIATFWTLLFIELRAAHPDYQAEAMSAP